MLCPEIGIGLKSFLTAWLLLWQTLPKLLFTLRHQRPAGPWFVDAAERAVYACKLREISTPPFSHSAVQMCCFNGHLRQLQLLIKKKASIDLWWTPERFKLNESPSKCCDTALWTRRNTQTNTHYPAKPKNNSCCLFSRMFENVF